MQEDPSIPPSVSLARFARSCNVDPTIDVSYLPYLSSVLSLPLPTPWVHVLDPLPSPDGFPRRYYHDKNANVSSWEHPLAKEAREKVQQKITADENEMKLKNATENGTMTRREIERNARRRNKKIMKDTVEGEMLSLKSMYGDPAISDLNRPSPNSKLSLDCQTVSPYSVSSCCSDLGIDVVSEGEPDRAYVWMARIVAVEGMKFGWTRVASDQRQSDDDKRHDKQFTKRQRQQDENGQRRDEKRREKNGNANDDDDDENRRTAEIEKLRPESSSSSSRLDPASSRSAPCRYRHSSWSDPSMTIRELPAVKYWRSAVSHARADDDAEIKEGGKSGGASNGEEGTSQSRRLRGWNRFKDSETGKYYTFDFARGALDYESSDVEDGTDEGGKIEDRGSEGDAGEMEGESGEEEQSKGTANDYGPTDEGNDSDKLEDVKSFALDCEIPWREVQRNHKLMSYLKSQLASALPLGFLKYYNPDGLKHYYSSELNSSVLPHPRSREVSERYARLVARREKIDRDGRISERRRAAMERSVRSTEGNVRSARLREMNREKAERGNIKLSNANPEDEAYAFYRQRYGSGDDFLKACANKVLEEIEVVTATNDAIQVTPAQVIQMSLFFGIRTSAEPHMAGIAMLAVLAPLPPFWYVVSSGGGFGSVDEASEMGGGSQVSFTDPVNVKSIDFTVTEAGGSHFTPKEEKLNPLMFARDVRGKPTHKQRDHPADKYWRDLAEECRESAESLCQADKVRCCILPFFNNRAPEGERLYYYNFSTNRPIFAGSNGDFAVAGDDGTDGDKLKLPRVVAGQGGWCRKRASKTIGRIKARSSKGAIFKYKPAKDVAGVKSQPKVTISLKPPKFFPPIPKGETVERVQEEDTWEGGIGILEAENFLTGGAWRGGEQEERGALSVERPRTRQDEISIANPGSLFVGYSGMQRPLHVAKNTIAGRGGTPWDARDPQRGVNDNEIDRLVTKFSWQAAAKGQPI